MVDSEVDARPVDDVLEFNGATASFFSPCSSSLVHVVELGNYAMRLNFFKKSYLSLCCGNCKSIQDCGLSFAERAVMGLHSFFVTVVTLVTHMGNLCSLRWPLSYHWNHLR